MQKIMLLTMFIAGLLAVSGSGAFLYAEPAKDDNMSAKAIAHDYWKLSPKKQMDAGLAPNEVVCKEGLQLMVKNNGNAICVKKESAVVLAERGLATAVPNAPTTEDMSKHMDAKYRDAHKETASSEDTMAGKVPELTEEEREWVVENPTINVAYDPSWPPLEYIDKNGDLAGLATEYMPRLESRTGLDFVPIQVANWTDALESIRDGRADIIISITDTEERQEFMGFTTPHTTVSVDMLTLGPQEISVESLSELNVATVKDYSIESWLQESHPEVVYTSFETPATAIEALDMGHADVFLDSWIMASHIAAEKGIEGMYNAGPTGSEFALSIGFQKDMHELGAILQKALDTIHEDERMQILEDVTRLGSADMHELPLQTSNQTQMP